MFGRSVGPLYLSAYLSELYPTKTGGYRSCHGDLNLEVDVCFLGEEWETTPQPLNQPNQQLISLRCQAWKFVCGAKSSRGRVAGFGYTGSAGLVGGFGFEL